MSVTCVEVCFNNAIVSTLAYILYAMLCDLLTVQTVVLSQKSNTLTYSITGI